MIGLALALACAAMRVIRDERLRVTAMGATFVAISWPVLRLFNHLVMTTALPMQDALLARWDAALGLDWLGYARWIDGTHLFARALAQCYSSLTMVSCLAFLAIVSPATLSRRRILSCFSSLGR
ncbi:MAG TPA: hypothetical protein VHV26_16515 [Rhizomicrobium sp.]|nr:hypothetical protein [Rhizomicrobium sp.]